MTLRLVPPSPPAAKDERYMEWAGRALSPDDVACACDPDETTIYIEDGPWRFSAVDRSVAPYIEGADDVRVLLAPGMPLEIAAMVLGRILAEIGVVMAIERIRQDIAVKP